MQKALILHGTGASSKDNWFPWLKTQLELVGYKVWCPDLPHAEQPNIERYSQVLLHNPDFVIDENTILIGHSSGSVAILGLLQNLPANQKVKACYLVGSFKDNLGRSDLADLFITPFDFKNIKTKSKSWWFIHSDDDPYCPLAHAKYLHNQLGGELVVISGQKHFSVGTAGEKYREFPRLLELITETN